MGAVKVEISMSLDGYSAGPNITMEEPIGVGSDRLHGWAFDAAAWREPHGRGGGERNQDSELIADSLAKNGAYIMGRHMFSGEGGPWGAEPFEGWWGEEPPFRLPVYVLTHHAREPLVKGSTTFYFVTDGIESALAQARDAAGDKDVQISGGADVVQQYLAAGLVDELQIHVAPVLLGGGVRLFDALPRLVDLEPAKVVGSPKVAHLYYRIPK